MKKSRLSTRLAEPKDADKCAKWSGNSGNPASTASGYPSALTVAVDEDGEPALFQTLHPVLMLEALVVKPGLSTKRSARAINELYAAAKRLAESYGMKEMYFFTKNPPMINMVTKKRGKGKKPMFELVEGFSCLRCKL